MTTDITELAQRLKAAAEKATPGPWEVQFGEEIYATDGVDNEQVAIATLDARDADYIALANPANVLALVEALEKAQGMETYWKTQCRGITDHCEELQARIAELESHTVKMPEPFKLAKSSSGLTYYFADDVDAALTDAGIKVEDE